MSTHKSMTHERFGFNGSDDVRLRRASVPRRRRSGQRAIVLLRSRPPTLKLCIMRTIIITLWGGGDGGRQFAVVYVLPRSKEKTIRGLCLFRSDSVTDACDIRVFSFIFLDHRVVYYIILYIYFENLIVRQNIKRDVIYIMQCSSIH